MVVPAKWVVDVADQAGELGLRTVCVTSTGFAEAGEEGAARQDDSQSCTRRTITPPGAGDGRGRGGDARGGAPDPRLGPALLVGLGGELVELLEDVSVRITPVTDVAVEDMLRSLQTRELLTGCRRRPPVFVRMRIVPRDP